MEDIKRLQNKILEIALYFDRFCQQHNLKYFLAEGTALGAIRHKGFIPWDDDFDVFMTFDNYKKFLECADKFLDKEKYYLQKENTEEWPLYFTKLRMNGTTFIEENTKNRIMHQGIFIDIICLNNIADNKIMRYLQNISSRLLNKKASTHMGIKDNSFKGKIILALITLIVCKPVKYILYKIVKMYNKKNTEDVGYLFFKQRHNKLIIHKNIIGNKRLIDFNGYKLPIFEKAEDYLALKYGKDYMEIPDEYAIKKEYSVHAVYWDTEKDYKEYQRYDQLEGK